MHPLVGHFRPEYAPLNTLIGQFLISGIDTCTQMTAEALRGSQTFLQECFEASGRGSPLRSPFQQYHQVPLSARLWRDSVP